ncbi:MAG TPA: zinc ribbon domain-containing protein [Anaerolineales bacterium]|nr:zinc ribbon domain-containing protein [Anaerolineales bacterium]
MDVAALLTALAVLILVVIFLAQPLLGQRAGAGRRAVGVSSWEAEVDRTVETLRELDFDHALGKIPEDEYPLRRQELVAQGADQLRRLDEARGTTGGAPGGREQALEREITALRVPRAERDAALEAEITSRRAQPAPNGAKRKTGFCPACGTRVQVGDKFCPSCGTALRHEKTT